jgi:hypothetical protein
MAEQAGFNTVLKISGDAVAMVGEATTEDVTTKIYQITDTAKRVLDRTATIRVHKQGADDTAEDGTTSTNIEMTAHGLVAGDLIINTTHAGTRLVVAKVDDNNITVAEIVGMAEGDTIEIYKTEDSSLYTLNRLNGTVTYSTATSRVIKVSGSYLPMTTAAYAHNASVARATDVVDVTAYGSTHRKRKATLKYASGSLSQFDVTDTTYNDALIAGVPVVLELSEDSTVEPTRYWVLLESDEVTKAIDGVQDETVTWVSYDKWLRLGV